MRNMLAVWREHGVDEAVRAAWEPGVVLAGLSAGAMCWFEGGDQHERRPTRSRCPGSASSGGSLSVHLDGESERLPVFRDAVAAGALPARLRGRRRGGARVRRPRTRRMRRVAPRGSGSAARSGWPRGCRSSVELDRPACWSRLGPPNPHLATRSGHRRDARPAGRRQPLAVDRPHRRATALCWRHRGNARSPSAVAQATQSRLGAARGAVTARASSEPSGAPARRARSEAPRNPGRRLRRAAAEPVRRPAGLRDRDRRRRRRA